MSAIGHAWDRLRLRHAPPQVRAAYWMWREVRAGDLVIGNVLHAEPHFRVMQHTLRQIRNTDPSDAHGLDELLAAFRRGYDGFQDVVARDDLITPLGEG